MLAGLGGVTKHHHQSGAQSVVGARGATAPSEYVMFVPMSGGLTYVQLTFLLVMALNIHIGDTYVITKLRYTASRHCVQIQASNSPWEITILSFFNFKNYT